MNEDLQELVDRHLSGELVEAGKQRLAEMLDSDPAARREFVEHAQWSTRLAEMMRAAPDRSDAAVDQDIASLIDAPAVKRDQAGMFSKVLLAVAAVVIIALSVSLYFQGRGGGEAVVKITGLSGSLLWTGDGGRVVHDLDLGRVLPGGTIEGVAPDSWIELEFKDGSTVTVLGNSMLTFSDLVQKELHLKGGKLACDVRPQPDGRPMLVSTLR